MTNDPGSGRRKINPKKKTTEPDETEPVNPQRVKKGTVYKSGAPDGYKGRHTKKKD